MAHAPLEVYHGVEKTVSQCIGGAHAGISLTSWPEVAKQLPPEGPVNAVIEAFIQALCFL